MINRVRYLFLIYIATALVFVQLLLPALSCATEINKWRGGGPSGDFVHDIAVDRGVSGRVYAVTSKGVFKTVDGGEIWTALSRVANETGRALALEPGTPGVIYLGTVNGGVFKSTDDGISWAPASTGLMGRSITALAMDPNASGTIYAITGLANTGMQIFKSTNGGESWSACSPKKPYPSTDQYTALAVDLKAPGALYAGTQSSGVMKSTDGGATWATFSTGFPDYTNIRSLAVDPHVPGKLYAGIVVGDFLLSRLCISTDGGMSWAESSWRGQTELLYFPLACDPQVPGTIHAIVCNEAFRSTDGGLTWSAAVKVSRNCVISMAVDPNAPGSIYVGTSMSREESVLKSTDGGDSWDNITTGYLGGDIGFLAASPDKPGVIYGLGASKLIRTIDGGLHWSKCGMEGLPVARVIRALAVGFGKPEEVYVSVGGAGIYKSIDAGEHWVAVNLGLTNKEVTAFAIDPNTPTTVYAGTTYTQLFKTTNGGGAWKEIKPGDYSFIGDRITAILVDPKASDNVYAAGERGSVFRTRNAGTAWTTGYVPRPGLILSLALDPNFQNILYAGSDGAIWRSTDRGSKWALFAHTPLAASVRSMIVDPEGPGTVFASASSAGVRRSVGGSALWSAFNTGLPASSSRVAGLARDCDGKRIYAATDTGIYWLDYVPPPLASFHASPTVGAPPLEVRYTSGSSENVSAWRWDFGDGKTSNLRNPVHTYFSQGLYRAKLTVSGPGGKASSEELIHASRPPVLSGPPSGPGYWHINDDCQFTGSAHDPDASGPLRYRFWWGDGASSTWSTNAGAVHKWTETGRYCVRFQAMDSFGVTSPVSDCAFVNIQSSLPRILEVKGPRIGAVFYPYTFKVVAQTNAPGGASYMQYRFDWGDGTWRAWSFDPAAVHAWRNKGKYFVKVQVRDNQGNLSEPWIQSMVIK